MRIVMPILMLMLASSVANGTEIVNNCVACHLGLSDSTLSAPAHAIAVDVHTTWRISCADCHGGDAKASSKVAAKDPATGYTGAPTPREIPSFCGRCHSDPDRMHRANPSLRIDQEALYRSSVHGTLLARGDTLVATCTSCHGVHGMLAVDDPRSPVYPPNVVQTCTHCHSDAQRMAGYTIPNPDGFGQVPLPTNQGEAYLKSVHANALYEKGDLSAPTCNSCHGNHGAAPPGVATVSAVCRQCHVAQADVFDASVHKDAFYDAEYPDCTSCHANHEVLRSSDGMVGDSEGAVCRKCHFEGDEPLVVAGGIRRMLDSLSIAIAGADSILTKAAIAGMEISEGRMVLREATDGLIRSRNVVHSVDEDEVQALYHPAIEKAREANEAGRDLLHEVTVRRSGLAISLVLIALLAVALIIKIRQVDREAPRA